MSLTPGTRLGIYEVTAKIGEGGMGEVYQARDTTLDRDVALRMLPEAFTSDPDRLARFERIPWQFPLAGEPTYFGPRGLFLYFTPWLGVLLLVLMGLSLAFLPANGNPAVAFLSVGAFCPALQLLLIWLVERWARTQHRP